MCRAFVISCARRHKMDNQTRLKSEPSDEQPRSFLSRALPEATTGLKLQLWNTSLACEKLCQKIRDLGDEHETLKQEQHDRIANLQEELNWLRRANDSLHVEINRQRADYSLLVGDIGRVCDERQIAIQQRDAEQFQKEMNNLMLDQYRDESAEKKKRIEEQDVEIKNLTDLVARLETDARNQWCYYERCLTEGGREKNELLRLLNYERSLSWQRRLATASTNERGRRRGARKS
ncbi:hypothetical protein F4813DRAFT_367142 [Daldinia decipiens]|uniref:uncharacterized protein n=1 Tax=Daldinia decipiens TaxID=326647 RepID=UPI0020C3E59E|nr:uncharacterized protein F4813DRAFT_367142 [Daldinia decipiens]KAI1655478.1 hypothetical protein F4813DRAFT_367142 [Daldinia decipiens]